MKGENCEPCSEKEAVRERTLWTWKLRLYPLVLIPMVWFNFVAPSGELAEDASRGKLLGYQDEAQSQANGVGATPLQGYHRGEAVVCETQVATRYRPRITHCLSFKHRETLRDG